MKIGAKLKGSLACDNNGKLYSWGSSSSGLLGIKSENHISTPTEVPINYENTLYKVEKISVGHFHVGAIANRNEISTRKTGDSVEGGKGKIYESIFKKLQSWYEITLIESLKSNSKSFLRNILKCSNDNKYISYKSIESLFLDSFYSYLCLQKKDVFKIEQYYEKVIKGELQIPENKEEIDISKFERLFTYQNKSLQEMRNFYNFIIEHFISYPDDFPFFVKFACQFKPFISLKTMLNLFDYMSFDPNGNQVNKDFDHYTRVCSFFNEIKISTTKIKEKFTQSTLSKLLNLNEEFYVETNYMIDWIINKKTGSDVLFMWGINSEGRLGIDLGQSKLNNKDSKKEENSELSYLYEPTMVIFPSVHIRIISISCGYAHSLALTYTKHVYSWGSGKYGCLGQKNTNICYTPKLIETDISSRPFEKITSVACGMYFSLALSESQSVYSWGFGANGRLGHGDDNSVGNPKIITYFENENIKIMTVKCGDTHSAAISISKELYSWGSGNNGMLGHGNYQEKHVPAYVEFFRIIKIDDVYCGSGNCMVLTSDNRVFAWGKNSHGMLGVSSYVDQNILIPQQILFREEDSFVKEISLGSMHTLMLMSDGTLYVMGNSLNGILGVGNVYDKVIEPMKIENLKFYITKTTDIREGTMFNSYNSDGSIKVDSNVVSLATIMSSTSTYNTAFVLNTGDVYMAGEDRLIVKSKQIEKEEGQTEKKYTSTVNDKEEQTWSEKLSKITCPELSEKVTFIAVGKSHVIAVARGKAYSWGVNEWGKLGLSNKPIGVYINYPNLIEKVGENVKMASVSDTHSLVLTHNGEIYGFGQNMYGKLGIGNISKYFIYDDQDKLSEPYEPEPQMVKNIIFAEYIHCGNNHSACIMKYNQNYENSYKIFTWGSGFAGKLGNNTLNDKYEPEEIDSSELEGIFFIQVSLGEEFSLGLDLNQDLWGWGRKKYLGFYNDQDVKNDFLKTPKLLNKDLKFKYISTNETACFAVDVNGSIFGFGKITLNNKSQYIKITKEALFRGEPMEYVSLGQTHYSCISSEHKIPFTWGSNIFFKCGQKFIKGGISSSKDTNISSDQPKKIEFFTELFIKNDTGMNKIYNNNVKSALMTVNEQTTVENEGEGQQNVLSKVKKNKIQLKLLEEKTDFKNTGLIKEDIKLNKLFYTSISEYFKILKSVEESRLSVQLETENRFISIINKSKTPKNSVYRSEVPKILNMNFQIYEGFLTILQIHPCYLNKVLREIKNKKTFIPLVKTLFGKSQITMKNKRVILILMGLWNSIFEKEKIKIKVESDLYDDLITYDLYSLIFSNSNENTDLVVDIVSEVILLYINEICSNENTRLIELSEDCDILSIYKEMGNFKEIININACKLINERLSSSFMEINKNKIHSFSYSVLWIYKKLVTLFYSQAEKIKEDEGFKGGMPQNEKEKLALQPLNKLIDYFIFNPFLEFLKSIKETNLDSNSSYSKLVFGIVNCLERNKLNSKYSQLYNLYLSNKQKCENVLFKKLAFPKNEVLKQVIELFTALSKGDILNENIDEKLFLNAKQAKAVIMNLNKTLKDSLLDFEYDFTLNALKELIKSNSEHNNEISITSISIKDLIDLQTNFLELLNDSELEKNDPLRTILYQLVNFKLNDLETTSNIRNFVLNFYLRPNCFYYQSNKETVLLKCPFCQLPLPDIFFEEETIKEALEGRKWTCSNPSCEYLNSKNDVNCKLCKSYKSSNDDLFTFFRRFQVPNDDEYTLAFEEVMYILPQLNAADDIEKEIQTQIESIKTNKESVNKKEILTKYERFISLLKNCLSNNDDYSKYEQEKQNLIKKWSFLVEGNIKSREDHSKYIQNIYDFIQFIVQSGENSKILNESIIKATRLFIYNLNNGYVNNFVKETSPLVRLSNDNHQEEVSLLKKFHVSDLIKNKIIDEILFNQTKQKKLEQKSVLFFEKNSTGYDMKLVYKEIYRKYIVCGSSNKEFLLENHFLSNEAIMELRRVAKANGTFNIGNIRFNTFYLVKLLNRLENE